MLLRQMFEEPRSNGKVVAVCVEALELALW